MLEKIIIFGSRRGQVAAALADILHDDAVIFSRSDADLDFSDYGSVVSKLSGYKPKFIVNAAAYTDVNKAESEEADAYLANATFPASLAIYCKERDIPLVHYSSDYVLSGEGNHPHKETEEATPLNAYGRTKLAGEHEIEKIGGKYLIFRTSWVYNHYSRNFFTTMLNLAKDREELSVVADQIGAPTYAPHLSHAIIQIMEKSLKMEKFPSGLYHLCNSGETSWHDYAEEIFALARKKGVELKVKNVIPISTDKFPSPAKRPLNSRLDCSKVKEIFGVEMPDWKVGLEECLEQKIESN